MLGRKKHKVLIWFVTSLWLVASCGQEIQKEEAPKAKFQIIQGETQGTTYGIKIVEGPLEVSKKAIDSILHDFDLSLSGYIPESVVNQCNKWSESIPFVVPIEDQYFDGCFYAAQGIFEKTAGAFDPTVLPLMELWGFLKRTKHTPSDTQIDSVLAFTGFTPNELYYDNPGCGDLNFAIRKNDSRLKLDFNAIAQGYSVDVLGNYLRTKGCKDYYIEIGGEILVAGKNPDGEDWRIGIDKPVPSNNGKTERIISAVVSLKNKAVATSGNYRKFYKKNGKIYAHTLNPKTGMPAENELLSATVVADNAAEADGMATAFMVMGLSKAKAFLKDHSEYDGFFIYRGENNALKSYASSGMKKMLQ